VARLIGYAAFALAMLAPSAARAEWREAETAHFKIYSDGGEGQLVEYAQRLEGLDQLLRAATRISADLPPTKVRVILFATVEQVRRAYHGHDRDIGGFYTVNMQGPIAISTRGKDSDDETWGPDVTLFHEYAHHFMLEYFPVTYPAWYVEGFAEIASTATLMSGGRIMYGKAANQHGWSLTSSRWVPIPQLIDATYASFPEDSDFYGESWLLAHYLTFSPARRGQLAKYLAELGAGVPNGQAATDAFGNLDQLSREVRSYLDAANFPARAVPVTLPAKDAIRMRVLSPGEADVIPETAAFDQYLGKEQMTAYLAGLQAKAARYPADPYVLGLLADADYAAEDYAAAAATVDRLLAIAPDSVSGRVRKGMLLLHQAEDLDGAARQAKVSEARRLIVAANQAALDDPRPLVAYYRSYVVAGERPPKQAVEGLMQAVSTVPQDPGPRMMLVGEMVNENKLAEAIYYLGPVAYDPHGGRGENSALSLIRELKQRLAHPAPAKPAP
jgi:tetratricopeptide (TPR) repeat protein